MDMKGTKTGTASKNSFIPRTPKVLSLCPEGMETIRSGHFIITYLAPIEKLKKK